MPRQLPVTARADQKIPELGLRVSGPDAAFLYIERKEIPLHMAVVSVFDGPICFDDFVANIESKLDLIPRYRQIVVLPPYNLGEPTWMDDPHFDIRKHIFHVRLEPPGGEAELEDLAGRILSQVMDRSKPLWDIYVVDGLADGRGALIPRVHHSLADGVTGVALLNVLFDTTADGSLALHKPSARAPKAPPAEPSLTEALGAAVYSTLDSLIAAEEGLVEFARALFSEQTSDDLKGLLGVLPELAVSVERLPFNKPCGAERKFCWAEFDFAAVQAIRKAAGGTVNDVILAVLTRALARYVKLHKQSVVNRFVRIACPVSLRRGEQYGDMGNQISFMPVALPLDVTDPIEMLKAVAARTETMKRARASELVSVASNCISAAPPALQALFWKTISQVTLPVPLLNMVCTNVPGSPVALYAGGRRMLASYPQVPTGYELGVGCAVQSYDGKLFFGLIADAHVARDVRRLRDFLYVSFRELCRSAGVTKARRPAKPRAKTSAAAKPATVAATAPAEQAPAEAPSTIVTDEKAVA